MAARRALPPEPPPAAPSPGDELDPEHARWVELNNDALTDLTAGDLTAAIEKLARCLAAEPHNAVFRGNLAEALVRLARIEHERGQLESALENLARAIELGALREDHDVLLRIHARWERELELGHDDWTEGSNRFELTFDTDREDILDRSHEVLEHLELSYEDLVRWFGSDPIARGAGTPIRVVLYDPEDFDRLTGLGDWASGVFDGVVRVSVRDLAAGQGWRSVLVHELVHAFVQALGGQDVPGWLNEGLAQMLEGPPGEIARLSGSLRGAELFGLDALAGSLAGWEDRSSIARAYAQSLVFVDYLRRAYGEEGLRRMLAGLAAGETAAAAFERFSSVPLATAFEDWRAELGR
jgi:tetratricopeptide (TPR) repeat protein